MDRNIVHTETLEDVTINIFYMDSPFNPFDDEDGNPPLAVYSDGRIKEYAIKYGNVNTVPTLTREQIKANLKEILDFVPWPSVADEGKPKTLRTLVWEYRGGVYKGVIQDAVNEAIREQVDCAYDSERLEALEKVYDWAGIPCLLREVRGYSQGDWAKVLAVATPKFVKACGNAEGYWDDPEKLKGSIDLFKYWAYGDVYGFEVLDENGDEIESCSGYYGDYEEADGPLDEARQIARNYIEKRLDDARKLAHKRQMIGGLSFLLFLFLMAVAGAFSVVPVAVQDLSNEWKITYSLGSVITGALAGYVICAGGVLKENYGK